MQSLISAVVIVLLVMLVEPHPICKQTSEPTCYTNLTANLSFLNEWLSLNDESKGLDQLRKHKHNSIANILINLTKHDAHDCLETYRSMVTVPQSVNATVDIIRDYFNAYLMHKAYVKHLIELDLFELWSRGWIESSKAHNNLAKLLTPLNDSVKKLAQLLNNTCSGCTRNCTTSIDKSAALISAMEKCNSPLHNVVNVIVEHSTDLYKIVKKLSKHQPAGVNIEMVDIPSTDIDNLCYCSVRTKTA